MNALEKINNSRELTEDEYETEVEALIYSSQYELRKLADFDGVYWHLVSVIKEQNISPKYLKHSSDAKWNALWFKEGLAKGVSFFLEDMPSHSLFTQFVSDSEVITDVDIWLLCSLLKEFQLEGWFLYSPDKLEEDGPCKPVLALATEEVAIVYYTDLEGREELRVFKDLEKFKRALGI